MRSISVSVTKKHILNGAPKIHCLDALALALQGKGYKAVSVGLFTASFQTKQAKEWTGELPPRVQKFIRAFDNLPSEERVALQPFKFTMKLSRSD